MMEFEESRRLRHDVAKSRPRIASTSDLALPANFPSQCCSGRRANLASPGDTQIAYNGDEYRCDAILPPTRAIRHGFNSCRANCCNETLLIFVTNSPTRTGSSSRKH